MTNLLNVKYQNPENTFLVSQVDKPGYSNMLKTHIHNSYEIYYLVSGERFYFVEDRTFHIQKGDLVIINRNVLHKTTDAGVPHKRLLIEFARNFIASDENPWCHTLFKIFEDGNTVIKLLPQDQNSIESLYYKMLKESQDQPTAFEVRLRGLLLEMLIFITRCIEKNPDQKFEYPNPMHKKISDIVQYINKNYSNPLTLTSLSDHFYISPFYLTRLFKEVTGFTFIDYLNNVRIKEAQKLLRETQMKVITLSQEVGYKSIAHFGRVFKAITGTSPLNYRKSIRS